MAKQVLAGHPVFLMRGRFIRRVQLDVHRNQEIEDPALEWWLLALENGVIYGVPDTVENLHFEFMRDSRAKVSWNPPSDHTNPDNQSCYYKVFRDNALIAKIDNIQTTFVD